MEGIWGRFRALPASAQIVGWFLLAPFLGAIWAWRSNLTFGRHMAVGLALLGTVSYAAMGASGGEAPVETQATEALREQTDIGAVPMPSDEASPPLQSLYTPDAAPTVSVAPEPPATPTVQPPPPKPKPVAVKPKPKPATKPASDCHPSYRGACLKQNAGDYDCAGGSGDGPNYVEGPIEVVGYDEFRLDHDKDGIACE